MTADEARAMTKAYIAEYGQDCTFIRPTGEAPNTQISANATVRAHVSRFSGGELLGGSVIGSRRILVVAEDLAQQGFPLPVLAGDQIEVADDVFTVSSCDTQTRALASAYEIVAS